MYAHGANFGHGYVKYLVIDEDGHEVAQTLFPSQIAPAEARSTGAIASAEMIETGGRHWWVGDDAAQLGTPRALLTQDRLTDPVFLPVLAKAAVARLGMNGAAAGGFCVTGLPGAWADDEELCKRLSGKLKEALPGYYSKIVVIAEQEALAFAQMLDTNGVLRDDRYRQGRGLSLDLGHHTDDAGKLDKARRVKGSFNTYQTGTARALVQIQNRLRATFDRDFSLHAVDQAVRDGFVTLGGGRQVRLPRHWDQPLIENAQELVNQLQIAYGSGNDLDYVLLSGGGALVAAKVDAVRQVYPFTEVVEDPQFAIARGYARLARMRANTLRAGSA